MAPRTSSSNFTQKDGVTLQDHLEDKLKACDARWQVAFQAQRDFGTAQADALKEAVRLLAHQYEIKFEAQNEWRGSLNDFVHTLATKDEVVLQVDKLRGEYCLQMDRANSDIKALNGFMNNMQGKASQTSVIITLLLSVAALILSIAKAF